MGGRALVLRLVGQRRIKILRCGTTPQPGRSRPPRLQACNMAGQRLYRRLWSWQRPEDIDLSVIPDLTTQWSLNQRSLCHRLDY
jgi:hypothetical protein